MRVNSSFNYPPFDSEDAKVIRTGGYAKKGVASFLNASYFVTISSSWESVFRPVASYPISSGAAMKIASSGSAFSLVYRLRTKIMEAFTPAPK